MKDLREYFTTFICPAEPEASKPRRGRPPIGERAMTRKEHKAKERAAVKAKRIDNIAILDMETDPFDADSKRHILPFLAVLYSDNFEPVIIWEENYECFVEKVIASINALPDKYTIYAHNGGKFDYLFLVHKLRGPVSFKGRGIMSASVGNHEIRDSFHIIPERLAAYQKDIFDYKKLVKEKRGAYREEIIRYCLNDCRYLLDMVKRMTGEFGLKLSIGQMAMAKIREDYDVKKLSEGWDTYLRQYYFGGRVECIRGRGNFEGAYKLYDTNSMYPFVMASRSHPVGDITDYRIRAGVPSNDTIFIDVNCRNNGALIARADSGETTARISEGRFFTTIWEYEVALKYNLISNVSVNFCLDCALRTDFSKFVLPLYDNRLQTKSQMAMLKASGQEALAAFHDLKKDDMFYKFLLNNGYGKFCQDPRRYKEHYLTDPGDVPPVEWFKSFVTYDILKASKRKITEWSPDEIMRAVPAEFALPVFEHAQYWIWHKPNPSWRFNNVGTGASITGAARAVLLEAIQNATDPIYCDTDSIICRELSGVHIDETALGAWVCEDEFNGVVINGKKLYGTWHATPKRRTPEQLIAGIDPRYTIKSKGTAGLNWDQMLDMLGGAEFPMSNRAPTLTRKSDQHYMTRTIRATAPILEQ